MARPFCLLLVLLAFAVYSCEADCSVDKLCGCGAYQLCWKYTGEKLSQDAPWCYTQPLLVPENSGFFLACKDDSDCDFKMTCSSETRYQPSVGPKDVTTPDKKGPGPQPQEKGPGEVDKQLKPMDGLRIKQIAAGRSSLVLAVSMTNQLYQYDNGWTEVDIGPVKYVSTGFDGSVWIQTLDNKLWHSPSDKWNDFQLVKTDPMVPAAFSASAFDHAFVLSSDKFAHRYIGTHFGESLGDDKQAYTQVSLGKDNTVWAVNAMKSTAGQSIFRYDDETNLFVLVDGIGQSVDVYAEKPTANNRVVVGNHQGLWLWKGKKIDGTSWALVKGSAGCRMPAIGEKKIYCIDQKDKLKIFDN